jgi:hypothetical protein
VIVGSWHERRFLRSSFVRLGSPVFCSLFVGDVLFGSLASAYHVLKQ